MASDTDADLPAALSGLFASLLGHGSPTPWAASRPGDLVGLEHEYVVHSGARVLDFRELIGALDVPGRRLDPGDVNALRCSWGGVITADGAEAEIATPPVPRQPGFVGRIESDAQIGAATLGLALPAGVSLAGYSTHLSVATPYDLTVPAAELFVAAFAPGLMLLADRPDSPGLLVRPRPGRVELAMEYVSEDARRAAIAYATGAVLAVGRFLRSRSGRSAGRDLAPGLPPRLVATAVATADRPGWGLHRTAYGPDLLAQGRAARLATEDGRTITAQSQLEAAWTVARQALGRSAAPEDIEAADRLVFERGPLPLESPAWSAAVRVERPDRRHRRAGPPDESARQGSGHRGRSSRGSPFGSILESRLRGSLTVTAQFATWDTTVFAIRRLGGDRTAYAAVPRANLRRFLDQLDRGQIDGILSRYLATPATGRVLDGWAAALRPGLHDTLAPPATFIAPEAAYSPATPSPTPAQGAPPAGTRAGKTPVEEHRSTGETRDTGIPRWWFIGGGMLVGLLLLIVTALASGLLTSDSAQPTPAAPPTPDETTPLAAPSPTSTPVTAEPSPSPVTPVELSFPGHLIFDGCIAIDPQGATTVLSAVFTLSDAVPGVYQARFARAPGSPLAGSGAVTQQGSPVVIPMRATQFGTYDALQLTAPDGRPIDLGPLAGTLPLVLNAETDRPNGCDPATLATPTPRTLAGIAYLADVAPVNAAAADFASRLAAWTDATTSAQAQADAAPLLDAFRTIHGKLLGLAAAYPDGAPAIRGADDAVLRLIADIERLPDLPRIGRATWTATWTADLAALRAASSALRSALGLPAPSG